MNPKSKKRFFVMVVVVNFFYLKSISEQKHVGVGIAWGGGGG